jgi:hypothetical protein
MVVAHDSIPNREQVTYAQIIFEKPAVHAGFFFFKAF